EAKSSRPGQSESAPSDTAPPEEVSCAYRLRWPPMASGVDSDDVPVLPPCSEPLTYCEVDAKESIVVPIVPSRSELVTTTFCMSWLDAITNPGTGSCCTK